MILNNNNSITIVLSDTFLKVLGSHKYSDEFLEIWDSRKYTSYEKWVLAEEYSLIEEFTEDVKGIKIISTVLLLIILMLTIKTTTLLSFKNIYTSAS